MPTSARWEVTNFPQIPVKPVHFAGGQSRPPLQNARTQGSPLNKGELSAKLTEGIALCSYKIRSAPKFATFESLQTLRASSPCAQGEPRGVRNFELFQITREKSRKTEGVFLVGSRRSGGKSKSLRARFLLPAFSFGEAKENADGQLQISKKGSYIVKLAIKNCIFLRSPQFFCISFINASQITRIKAL